MMSMNEDGTIRKGPIPLYVQLAGALERRIKESYKAGDRFPTVELLGAQYGLAPITVRQALALLEKDGLISRARGRGTMVLKTQSDAGKFHLSTGLNDLVESTRDTQPQILRIALQMPPAELLPARGSIASQYRLMHRVHSIAGRPYAVVRIYLDERLYSSLPPALFEKETVVCALNTLHPSPIKTGRQQVTIGRAVADDASWLKVPVDSPVAQIKRYFYDEADVLIYIASVIYRGDFVSWEMNVDV